MPSLIDDLIVGSRIGAPMSFRNITVFPIISQDHRPDYQTLDQALQGKSARITEVTDAGSVPELSFENQGDTPVLLVDGEELVGAKQNRVLNVTIVVPARSRIVIPVSCVEQGRWNRTGREFKTSSQIQFASGRALRTAAVSESMRRQGLRRSDQAAVWESIHHKMDVMGSAAPTMAMADLFHQSSARLEEFEDKLPVRDGQTGAVFAINGRVLGMDVFDSAATYARLAGKLVRSYGLEAVTSPGEGGAPCTMAEVERFLEWLKKADRETVPAVGEGQEVRITGPELTGSAIEARGRVIHLSAFALKT